MSLIIVGGQAGQAPQGGAPSGAPAALVNNLVNITCRDAAYRRIQRTIMRHIEDEELRRLAAALPQLPLIATDDYFMHYSVYPMLRAENPDEVMNKVLAFQKEYMASKEYRRIKILTTLDHEMSLTHGIALTEEILRKIREELKRRLGDEGYQKLIAQLPAPPPPDGGGGGGPDAGSAPGGVLPMELPAAAREAIQRIQQAASEVLADARTMQKIVERANEAAQNFHDLREIIGGRGAGKEPGSFEKLLDLARLVRRVKMGVEILALSKSLLRSIPEFTMKAKAPTRHRTPLRLGVRKAKRPWEALPRELALPDDIFYAKLLNNDLLAPRFYRLAEGAYYVVIDKSGSMEGEKTVWARSVALALLHLARKKRRAYFLRFFDTQVYPPDRPISDPREALDAILRIASNGGTSIDTAIRVAVEDIAKRGLSRKTNTIILITDGEDRVGTPPSLLRAHNITLVAVMIHGYNEALRRLAEASGGQYLKVEPTEDGALRILKAAM